MQVPSSSRRGLLAALAAGGTMAIAGCSSSDPGGGTAGGPDTTTGGTTTGDEPTTTDEPAEPEITEIVHDDGTLYARLSLADRVRRGALVGPDGERFGSVDRERGETSLAFDLFGSGGGYASGTYEVVALDADDAVLVREAVELVPSLAFAGASVLGDLRVRVRNDGTGPARIGAAAAVRGEGDPTSRYRDGPIDTPIVLDPGERRTVSFGRPAFDERVACEETTPRYRVGFRIDHGAFVADAVGTFDVALGGYLRSLSTGEYACTTGSLVDGSASGLETTEVN